MNFQINKFTVHNCVIKWFTNYSGEQVVIWCKIKSNASAHHFFVLKSFVVKIAPIHIFLSLDIASVVENYEYLICSWAFHFVRIVHFRVMPLSFRPFSASPVLHDMYNQITVFAAISTSVKQSKEGGRHN